MSFQSYAICKPVNPWASPKLDLRVLDIEIFLVAGSEFAPRSVQCASKKPLVSNNWVQRHAGEKVA
jgi:hypothetical protein